MGWDGMGWGGVGWGGMGWSVTEQPEEIEEEFGWVPLQQDAVLPQRHAITTVDHHGGAGTSDNGSNGECGDTCDAA